MRRIVVEQEGRMVDELVAAVSGGDGEGRVEATLDGNPGLAAELAGDAHMLRLGRALSAPERSAAPRLLQTIKLWD